MTPPATSAARTAPALPPEPLGETVLVFPAGLPDSLTFLAQAKARGCTVIGASSLAFDPAAAAYDVWDVLPYVHEPSFAEQLAAVIRARGVEAIYSPHEVVSGVLAERLPRIAPSVRLIAANPLLSSERAYGDLLARAAAAGGKVWVEGPSGRPPLSAIERGGILRLVDTIPGMTDRDKVDALFDVMRHAPPGDIVEIGSWWGRSAALLVLLAHRWDVGSVLCVDPWRAENLPQGVDVLDAASARLDTDAALRIFQVNLAPLAGGRLNYLRMPSTEGALRYGADLVVETDVFGRTAYSGGVALLHIDGNHAYESVLADAEAWTPHVRPGGWIVFDDYVWAFGDGPRRVGDAWLARNAARIDLSFVTGTALFIRLAD